MHLLKNNLIKFSWWHQSCSHSKYSSEICIHQENMKVCNIIIKQLKCKNFCNVIKAKEPPARHHRISGSLRSSELSIVGWGTPVPVLCPPSAWCCSVWVLMIWIKKCFKLNLEIFYSCRNFLILPEWIRFTSVHSDYQWVGGLQVTQGSTSRGLSLWFKASVSLT